MPNFENILSFASSLREARKAAGMSQQQLAEKIGASRDVIVRMERGENVGIFHVLAAAHALGRKLSLAESGNVVSGKFDVFYAEKFRKPLEAEMRGARNNPKAAGIVKKSDASRIKVLSWNQAANI